MQKKIKLQKIPTNLNFLFLIIDTDQKCFNNSTGGSLTAAAMNKSNMAQSPEKKIALGCMKLRKFCLIKTKPWVKLYCEKSQRKSRTKNILEI